MHFAALDIGSNSVKTTVVRLDGSLFCDVQERSQVTGLAAGMINVPEGKKLAPDAMERTIFAVALQLAWLRKNYGDFILTGSATSAVRDAVNGSEFLCKLAKITGMNRPPHLLSGDEEAQMTFLGASSSMENGSLFLNADPGGGSTEMSFGHAGELPEKARSFQVGSVRWRERFGLQEICEPDALKRARDEARLIFSEFKTDFTGDCLSVSGGTATVALWLHLKRALKREEQTPLLTAEMLEELLAKHSRMTSAMRAKEPGMMEGRETVVPAGLTILLALLEATHARTILANRNGLRTGLIVALRDGKLEPIAKT